MEMIMKAIVAVDNNWAIGRGNELLCHISEDMKRFKELTTGNIVVMGRKTFESLPNKKPLPNRTNIILTTNPNYTVEGAEVVHSLYDLLSKIHIIKNSEQQIFVIGGGEIYKLLLPLCEEVYVTKIHYDFDNADVFFPNLDKDYRWKNPEEISVINRDEKTGLQYEFVNYVSTQVDEK